MTTSALEMASAGWSWEGNASRRRRLVVLVLRHYGTTCHLCRGPGATTADHVIPRSQGGLHTVDNLRPAHMLCNRLRGAMTLAEWFDRYPLPSRPALAPSRTWT